MIKHLVVAFLGSLFLAHAGFACPDLTGSFLCKQNSYRQDTLYSFTRTQFEDGTWAYTIAANPPGGNVVSYVRFLADGIERDVVDAITAKQLRVAASCQDQKLVVSGKANLDEPKPIHFYEELSLNTAGDLSNTSLDIQGEIVNEVCTRQRF